MRGGKVVADFSTEKTSPEELAENMVGRKVLLSIKKPTSKIGKPVLEIKIFSLLPNLRLFKEISLCPKAGSLASESSEIFSRISLGFL